MNKKRLLRKMIFTFLVMFLMTLVYSFSWAAQWGRADKIDLRLEKLSELNRTAVLNLTFYCGWDIKNTRIGCFLPEGIELIDGQDYKNKYMESGYGEWGYSVTFYEGPLKKDEKKTFKFKVHILDDKKYYIRASGGDATVAILELDLGDPEPPEWNPEVQERIKILPKQEVRGETRVKVSDEKSEELLGLAKGVPPPFRTEFKIRTKDRPNIQRWNLKASPDGPLIVPLRYLIYSEEETPKVEVNLFLPEGIELVNAQDYQISQEEGKTEVLLYSGPMPFKKSKAFYFQVKPQRREVFSLKVKTQLTNLKNEQLLKEDTVDIDLIPKRY